MSLLMPRGLNDTSATREMIRIARLNERVMSRCLFIFKVAPNY